ncbi:MAG: biotin--[acetyl-CoA-carboxylase] ligase [Candidatus Heimdallarchaeota archaeon]|nr:biotin--[acetyl-CoA-carboxylase] ligase [Candidatus Heimdallarchaeota archaeon]
MINEYWIDSKLCPLIFKYQEVGSTNNVARKLIEENNIGFTVVSEVQTAGYGSADKFWESPRGGLWCSLAIIPKIEIPLVGVIPILSAVAVAEVLDDYNVDTVLKWPNDILLKSNKKKIGGILVEGKTTQMKLNYLIIGIGLNINTTLNQYSPSLQTQIATISEELNIEIDLDILTRKIILKIEEMCKMIDEQGIKSLLDKWRSRNNILGMKVKVQTPEKQYTGIAFNITKYGQLILEIGEKKVTISSGTLSLC